MGLDNERVEAAVRSDAIQRAARMWAEEPLCRSMAAESEVYRFTWDSSFDGGAVVRIGREVDEIKLRWLYRWFSTPSPHDTPSCVRLTLAHWQRLQEALIAASFWTLDAANDLLLRGLDGAFWTIEGRRKDVYRSVRRWSPREAIHDLGLFFELAGPPLAGIEIY